MFEPVSTGMRASIFAAQAYTQAQRERCSPDPHTSAPIPAEPQKAVEMSVSSVVFEQVTIKISAEFFRDDPVMKRLSDVVDSMRSEVRRIALEIREPKSEWVVDVLKDRQTGEVTAVMVSRRHGGAGRALILPGKMGWADATIWVDDANKIDWRVVAEVYGQLVSGKFQAGAPLMYSERR